MSNYDYIGCVTGFSESDDTTLLQPAQLPMSVERPDNDYTNRLVGVGLLVGDVNTTPEFIMPVAYPDTYTYSAYPFFNWDDNGVMAHQRLLNERSTDPLGRTYPPKPSNCPSYFIVHDEHPSNNHADPSSANQRTCRIRYQLDDDDTIHVVDNSTYTISGEWAHSNIAPACDALIATLFNQTTVMESFTYFNYNNINKHGKYFGEVQEYVNRADAGNYITNNTLDPYSFDYRKANDANYQVDPSDKSDNSSYLLITGYRPDYIYANFGHLELLAQKPVMMTNPDVLDNAPTGGTYKYAPPLETAPQRAEWLTRLNSYDLADSQFVQEPHTIKILPPEDDWVDTDLHYDIYSTILDPAKYDEATTQFMVGMGFNPITKDGSGAWVFKTPACHHAGEVGTRRKIAHAGKVSWQVELELSEAIDNVLTQN